MILSKIRWVVFGVMATFLGVGCGVKEEPGDSSDLHAVYDEEGYHFHFAPKKGDEDLLTFWSCFTKAANTRLALGSCVPSFVSSSASWVPFDPEELKSVMSPEDRAAIDVILYGDDVCRDQ